MSFFEHLEELRWHLIRGTLALFLTTIVAFIYHDFVFDQIILGPTSSDFLTFKKLCWLSQKLGLGNGFCVDTFKVQVINLKVTGSFVAAMKISLSVGFITAFPYILYEIWKFVKPGLHKKEIRATQGFIFWCSLLFFLGVAFGYFLLCPLVINFLYHFQLGETMNTYDLNDIVGTISMIVLATGIMFQLPIAIYILSKMGLVTPELLRQYRRYAFIVILIISALITPADPWSQLLVTAPLLLLYEIGIFVSASVQRTHLRELE